VQITLSMGRIPNRSIDFLSGLYDHYYRLGVLEPPGGDAVEILTKPIQVLLP